LFWLLYTGRTCIDGTSTLIVCRVSAHLAEGVGGSIFWSRLFFVAPSTQELALADLCDELLDWVV